MRADAILDWLTEYIAPWLIIGVLISFVFFIGWGIYTAVTYKPPESISLPLNQWECRESHIERVRSGKTWEERRICDLWGRM